MDTTTSDLRARLLDLGFNLHQARAAVDAGNTTVESATEWIFDNSATPAPSTSSAGNNATLRLRDEQDEAFDTDLQQALSESSRVTYTLPTHTSKPSPAAVSLSPEPPSASATKKIKINIIRNEPSAKTTPLLPLASRHKDGELEAQNAARLAEANRRAEQTKREKMEARLARQRALNDLKEDRENRKLRTHHATGSSATAVPGGANVSNIQAQISTPTAPSETSSRSLTMVQLRLKNGSVLKRSFESSATLKDLFELARAEDGNIGSADISLIQPFPRKEFTIADNSLTLSDAGLCPSCSLNVLVQAPIPAPQPIMPGSWLPPDVEMEEPSASGAQDELMLADEEYNEGGGHGDEEDASEQDEVEDDQAGEIDDSDGDGDDDEDDGDDMMHALPMPLHPPQHPFAGGGRGRGRGRVGQIPFSGAGRALGSTVSASSTSQSGTPVESNVENTDVARRQRILDAMANRSAIQHGADNKGSESRRKKTKEKFIPTLQSLCSYSVAVMLAAKDSKSSKNLKLFGENVGSQIAEGIIQELIKMKQLDQLTFKRLYSCSIVNIVLDAYSRATDSLMDAIGTSQSRSLTYLSLKECIFLTDKGFSNIRRFGELEYLDLSHCRITDKTLEFTLDLPYLSTLHLSATKITTGGLARIISKAAWSSTLQTLDLSYCEEIKGPAVLVNLQELTGLRTLKLNNTRAFDHSPVQVPDQRAFIYLLHLDIARTPITNDDLVKLIPCFKSLEVLNLSSCASVTAASLESCVQELRELHNISFPNREHDLVSVLPTAAALPLTHLDLTGFLFVTDDAILSLSAATNLQMLSLAGTKLTDVGSAAFVHMSSLKELLLDRTIIGDKTMEYLRDLGRIEVLSLHRCERLTTAGMMLLGKCAFFSIKLKRLNLGYNKYIHDEALTVFIRCNELNTLNLEYTDVSEERALRLQESLPNLKQLRIQGITQGAVYEETPRPTFT
ncbi:hypothetical protein BC939DRAFT_529193 [Gamsiella multidivaricata]|uniref:uncharacterized protein n=1 Tax=Gamsiella multidivaricata TaxID=101098 RepID=UPI0022206DFE|nr:uncharacterized protein BC939DRAFT_529193 [Gamsiella multidivaricata]KAG0368675.1 hypothetical protein BGZ54_001434 [Gamsiella multidivaricata]KAI7822999.1 hypothetical protein BC939DRAFT_529193 [Gamsiella multidivaricata]